MGNYTDNLRIGGTRLRNVPLRGAWNRRCPISTPLTMFRRALSARALIGLLSCRNRAGNRPKSGLGFKIMRAFRLFALPARCRARRHRDRGCQSRDRRCSADRQLPRRLHAGHRRHQIRPAAALLRHGRWLARSTYPVGVGRAGKAWFGSRYIDRKRIKPASSPPAECHRDRPTLPNMIAGGSRAAIRWASRR